MADMDELMRQMQQGQGRQAEQDSEIDNLEDKVDGGVWNTVKDITGLGVTLAGSYALGGSLMLVDSFSIAAGFMGGKIAQKIWAKESTSYGDVLKDGMVGGMLGMYVNAAFSYLNPTTMLAKFAAMYPIGAAFMPIQFALDYVVRAKPVNFVTNLVTKPIDTTADMYVDVKGKLDATFGKVMKYMMPAFASAAAFLPRYMMSPVMGVLDVVYGAMTVGESKPVRKPV